MEQNRTYEKGLLEKVAEALALAKSNAKGDRYGLGIYLKFLGDENGVKFTVGSVNPIDVKARALAEWREPVSKETLVCIRKKFAAERQDAGMIHCLAMLDEMIDSPKSEYNAFPQKEGHFNQEERGSPRSAAMNIRLKRYFGGKYKMLVNGTTTGRYCIFPEQIEEPVVPQAPSP